MILFISESCPFYFQLPFSVIGSLNGVHMFGSNQDVLLTSTCTDNTRVCWRVFRDSITLIVMSSEEDASDLYLSRLLDNVFGAMVLVIGLDDLVNLKNVERLKRELRACYKLIDSLLTASDWIGDLTLCVDCVVSPDAAILQVPHRLLTFQLVPGVDVCLLCGPTPSLQQVQTELVERFWSPVLEPLKTCLSLHQCTFPICIPLHHSIIGLLLINREQNKNLFTLQPHGVERSQLPGTVLSPERRRSVLRQFYTLAVSAYFPAEASEDKPAVLLEEFHAGFTHSPTECYVAADDHKSYGIQTRQHQLLLTFTPETPTFTLRNIATKTLSLLTKEVPF
ncbi:protein fuzzy homolog isoform X4 [Leucoraja erinacea]|uniref:protein fuzzy homolog isoform X4 n=1 Tax=Leucoraja erinaceus TaxID=7782 RepID=UPI0024587D41|nr:protein fuzzy homolog isoform X4 [Leucoraja erinacea]